MGKGSPKEQMVAPLPTITHWSGEPSDPFGNLRRLMSRVQRAESVAAMVSSGMVNFPHLQEIPTYTLCAEGMQGVSADIVIIDDPIPGLSPGFTYRDDE